MHISETQLSERIQGIAKLIRKICPDVQIIDNARLDISAQGESRWENTLRQNYTT